MRSQYKNPICAKSCCANWLAASLTVLLNSLRCDGEIAAVVWTNLHWLQTNLSTIKCQKIMKNARHLDDHFVSSKTERYFICIYYIWEGKHGECLINDNWWVIRRVPVIFWSFLYAVSSAPARLMDLSYMQFAHVQQWCPAPSAACPPSLTVLN